MIVSAEFVASVVRADDVPWHGTPEIALVGRSNVGKSSLINALARQRIARTSAAPGKTRLINLYRLQRGAAPPVCLVDLPGYGYTRGGREAAEAFDALVRGYLTRATRVRTRPPERPHGAPTADGLPSPPLIGAILLIDSRHPGLPSDLGAQAWLHGHHIPLVLAGTKIDKLSRRERARAHRELEDTFNGPVLPVSAATGEGLEDLWKLIDKLTHLRSDPSTRGTPSSSSPR